ncbi:hypothetical protein K2X30_12170 [bacterium]|jgi:hypothetical protein|nr:hypothetical protein [bacterium]
MKKNFFTIASLFALFPLVASAAESVDFRGVIIRPDEVVQYANQWSLDLHHSDPRFGMSREEVSGDWTCAVVSTRVHEAYPFEATLHLSTNGDKLFEKSLGELVAIPGIPGRVTLKRYSESATSNCMTGLVPVPSGELLLEWTCVRPDSFSIFRPFFVTDQMIEKTPGLRNAIPVQYARCYKKSL